MPSTDQISRRHCIPIIYTRGTHYEVGYDVGHTFSGLIHSYLEISSALNNEYLPLYETSSGRKVYEETLAAVNEEFPQYIRELQGTADGAKVPFHKLFLLHMDEITPNAISHPMNGSSTGCTSICVNQPDEEILGHTEDAFSEALNHFYMVAAHIFYEKPEGKWPVAEERFMSLCYAGHLPGYTMNYNHHGLVFSINTLSANRLNSGKIPRHFLTRALLSAENLVQAQRILRDDGTGAADGCSINMTFLQQEGNRLFHNAELGPAEPGCQESQLNIFTASPGETVIHCNHYLRLNIEQVPPDSRIIVNSSARYETLTSFPTPICKEDVINMLGDQSGKTFCVFQDYEQKHDAVLTIAVGIFDCVRRTWSLYADNPKTTEPLVVVPLVLKNET